MNSAAVTQTSDQESGIASAQVEDFAPSSGVRRTQVGPAAIHFDPLRRAASPRLRADIKALTTTLEQQELSLGLRERARAERSQRGFRLAVEAIVCNFLALRLMRSNRPLAVPRRAGIMWSKRTAPSVYGQHFLDALDIMAHAETDLIGDVTKGYRLAGSKGRRSTINAGPNFDARFPPSDFEWESLTRDELQDALILRDEKDQDGNAPSIAYRATRRTNAMERQVKRFNAWLREAPLFMLDNELDDAQESVDPTDRNLRRIFNNGRWDHGGRLFGGFWQPMPREERFRYLRIGSKAHPEGERVANVDFSNLFPRLAYHDAGLQPPPDDLYDMLGDGSYRKGFKELTNAMLAASRRFRRYPHGVAKTLPPDLKVADAVALVERKHAPIADQFFTGVGFRFMFKESEMLIHALEALWKGQGVVALPLHDSVIVAQSNAETARVALETAFSSLNDGARGQITIDLG